MDAPDQHFWAPRLIESILQRCLVPPGAAWIPSGCYLSQRLRLQTAIKNLCSRIDWELKFGKVRRQLWDPSRCGEYKWWLIQSSRLGDFWSSRLHEPDQIGSIMGFVGSAGSRSELSKEKSVRRK